MSSYPKLICDCILEIIIKNDHDPLFHIVEEQEDEQTLFFKLEE